MKLDWLAGWRPGRWWLRRRARRRERHSLARLLECDRRLAEAAAELNDAIGAELSESLRQLIDALLSLRAQLKRSVELQRRLLATLEAMA